LLGAFVCFQLVAIPLGSFIKLVPVRLPQHRGEITADLQVTLEGRRGAFEPLQSLFDAAAWTTARWAEVSGQTQCWALFTAFGKQSAFPLVELRWPEGSGRDPVRIGCHFEPADPAEYFYPPEPCCRRFNYEYRMVLFHMLRPEDFPRPGQYRREALDCVRDLRRSLGAFLRWRMTTYLRDHPGTPEPECVTLWARVFPDPPPGAPRRPRPETVEVPFARWYPGRSVEPGFSPVEAFDLDVRQFVRLPLGEVR
jgi:hypothetical protein